MGGHVDGDGHHDGGHVKVNVKVRDDGKMGIPFFSQ